MIDKRMMAAAVLAAVTGTASAVLPPPPPAQVQAQAAKKAAADAQAEKDKQLLLARMDVLSNAWRGKAGAKGWKVNPPTALPAPLAGSPVSGASAALSAPAAQSAASGQPAGALTTTGANAPITSEKSGTAAPIADVRAFYSDSQVSTELQATFDGGGRARGVRGLYHFNGDAGGQVLNNFYNLSFGDTQGQVDTDSIAVYGEGTWQFNDQWSVTGGLRYTDEEKSADVLNRCYTNATYTTLAAACTATNLTPIAADFEDSETFTNVSPKISSCSSGVRGGTT